MTAPAAGRVSRGPDAVTVLTLFLVLLYAIPSPMVLSAMGQVGGPSTLLALACFLWWGWHVVQRPASVPGVRHPVRNAALFFLLCVALSYAHSAGLPLPADERSPADAALIRMLGAVGLVCLVAEGVPDRERLWVFLRRWTLVIGALCVLALAQIVTKQVLVDRLSLPGLSPALNLALIQRGVITRPSGTSTHPIEFAAVMAMSMPLVFAVTASERRRPWLFRAIALAVPLVVLLTGSRTAIICGGVAFAVMLFGWKAKTRLIAAGVAAVLMAGTFVVLPGFLGTLKGLFSGASNDPSVMSRTESYRIAGLYWDHHLWLGRGVGTFDPKYWVFDNMYLNLLVSGGVLCVVALVVLIAVSIRSALQARRLSTLPADRELAIAALAGVLAGAFALATFDVFGFAQAQDTFFLLVGLCGALLRLQQVEHLGGDGHSPGLDQASPAPSGSARVARETGSPDAP